MEYISIVFSTDHNYIMPTGVALSSLIRNSDSKYKIYILIGEDVTSEDKEKIQKCLRGSESIINYIEMGSQYSNAFETRGISISTYYRLSLPEILQEDKVIYADVDMIFQTDLKCLFDIDLKNNLIGAVKAYIDEKHAKKIGCDPLNYFNAGLLLLNLKQLRNEKYTEKFRTLLRNNYKYQDQDILNITCKGRVYYLPVKYNVTHSNFELCIKKDPRILQLYNYDELINIATPSIVHFSGSKPWNGRIIRDGIWWVEYCKSPFFNPTFYMNGLYKSTYKFNSLRQLIKSIFITIFSKC